MPHSSDLVPLGPKSDAVAGARELQQGKHRRQRGQFLVEGPDAVHAALTAGWLRALYTQTPADQTASEAKSRGARIYCVDARSISALSDTVTPQGPIGVAEIPQYPDDLAGRARMVVVCDALADPGNLGTVIRTAAAAGADAVITTTGSADFWSGKTVRATAGSFAKLPLLHLGTPRQVISLLTKAGFEILVTRADGQLQWGSVELAARLQRPHAWVVGSEAHGVGAELRDSATGTVTIPMHNEVESLNAAVAAALCMYESVRASGDF